MSIVTRVQRLENKICMAELKLARLTNSPTIYSADIKHRTCDDHTALGHVIAFIEHHSVLDNVKRRKQMFKALAKENKKRKLCAEVPFIIMKELEAKATDINKKATTVEVIA